MSTDLLHFIMESNSIEGIRREPLPEEIAAHEAFLALDHVKIEHLEGFVSAVQPGAKLRDKAGMNVTVGKHVPRPGGMAIVYALRDLLGHVNMGDIKPYDLHAQFEIEHPFTDGNGRSGRVLWLWAMGGDAPLGFLESWYRQSLDAYRAAR